MNLSVGATGRLTITCRDYEQTLQNPSTLIGFWQAPDGTHTDTTFTNISTGVYTTTIVFTAAGVWKVRVESAGFDTNAIFEASYRIRPSIIT